MSKKQFLSQFIKNRKEVGSVTPSSRFLVKKMLAPIDFTNAKHILELGAGSGVMTEELLKKAGPDAIIYCFELNERFCDALNALNDHRLIVINDSAEKITEYLAKHNCQHVDAVVSSLPFTVIPKEIEDTIMEEVLKCLIPGGTFTQFHYTIQRKKYKKRFTEVKTGFTALNVPPAFVYRCKS